MDSPGYYRHLTFNAPLSEARADALVARLTSARPTSVVDVGCGWGELLIRLAEKLPQAAIRGVDTDERLLQRARVEAEKRGVSISFENVVAKHVTEPADLVVCIGSSHALASEITAALDALRPLVRPGGRLVLGEGTWEEIGWVNRTFVWDDMVALPSIAQLVDQAVASGFRPLWIERANSDELFAFESGYLADVEEWLMTHTDYDLRERNDEHRRRWLHGYRNGFGFAYLTLGVPE